MLQVNRQKKRGHLVVRFLNNNTNLRDFEGHAYSVKHLNSQLTHCSFYQHSFFILKVSRGGRLFLSLVQYVWKFAFGDILGKWKLCVATRGSSWCPWVPQKENHQDILKGGWVQRNVFCDSYHSWPACGVFDLMIGKISIVGLGENFSVSDFISHRKKDLLK